MLQAPLPRDEKERLCALHGLSLLDTSNEERFDRITREAIKRFSVPISTITLVDEDREWYKSVQGLTEKQAPRSTSFCGHALISEIMLIVPDTLLDDRFKDNPMVLGEPYVRFYAGKSLYDHATGKAVGVFCIKGDTPKTMTVEEIADFLVFAERAEKEINTPSTK